MSALRTAGLRDIAAALTALDAGLDQAAALGPGWDGRGSPPVDPAVVPLSSGGVQLEWHDGPRVLELEFEGPATIHFLRWHPDGGVEDEDTYPASDRKRSEELIGWVRDEAADG